jgi:hypothetical protein
MSILERPNYSRSAPVSVAASRQDATAMPVLSRMAVSKKPSGIRTSVLHLTQNGEWNRDFQRFHVTVYDFFDATWRNVPASPQLHQKAIV